MIPRLRAVVVVGGCLVVGGCFAALAADAAAQDPVQWSAKAAAGTIRGGATFDVALTAKIDEEWHIYSVTQAAGGPVPTSVTIGAPFARAGAIRGPDPRSAYDPNFELRTETYDGTITLIVPVRAPETAKASTLHAGVTYQACTERLCLPPRTVTLSVRIPVATSPQLTPAPQDGAGVIPPKRAGDAAPAKADAPPTSHLTARAFGPGAATWGGFIWLAITMGALSLLTPCVFPMVPITVSYFTRHAAPTRGRAFASAALYGLGIVLTFTLFGSLVAAMAGAAGLNRFAASPWVNLLITALFVTFALNLFGVFELRLPVGMLSRLDGLSRRQGASVAGTLLMAMTFTITSLTCTAAFLGTLLVVAAQGEWLRPIAGLFAYSATFALPFVVLAAAPQLVSQLPRSGPWLARVKVIMGFLEIAAAMKFLSNADLVWSWGIFTRNVVLLSWTAIMIALAVYLAGRSAVRIAAAAATLAFAAWLASGVAGRRLGELEAFLPPAAPAAAAHPGELAWRMDDLDGALAEARASGKLVFIDFTGYTCTNCRWMEANMFPRPEVRDRLAGFVRARLYTDGQGDIDERQQRYQQERFATVALPLYAIVDAEQRPIATFAGLTRDPHEFLRFLSVQP